MDSSAEGGSILFAAHASRSSVSDVNLLTSASASRLTPHAASPSRRAPGATGLVQQAKDSLLHGVALVVWAVRHPSRVASGAAASLKSMTRTQVLILLYLSYTFTAYGFALFINGIGKRVVPSRPLLTDEQAEKVPDIVRLMAVTVNPMFTLASGRVLAMVGILAVMYWRKELPPSTERFTRRHLIPVAIGMANAGGYVFYMMLCSLNGIALWAGLSSVYVVCPVAYGLFVRHERRSPKKLFGILVCLGAAIMLGIAQSLDAKGTGAGDGADGLQEAGSANATAALDGNEVSSEAGGPSPLHASWLLKLVLFLLCIFSWGFCDGAASY
ncbi:hypothetical protein EON62_06395, partial [archaeon]